jgi:hypothetical protein
MAVGSGDRLDAAAQVSIRIHSTSAGPPMKMLSAGEGSHSSHAGAVESDKSGMGIVMAGGGCARLDDAAQLDTARSVYSGGPAWTAVNDHISVVITAACHCTIIHIRLGYWSGRTTEYRTRRIAIGPAARIIWTRVQDWISGNFLYIYVYNMGTPV